MQKIIIVLLLTLFSSHSYSQFHHFYFGGSKDVIKGIKYQDKYYSSSPRGLKQFIEETEMSSELKNNLSEQARKIANKRTISGVLVYGGFAVGGGIMFNEVLSKKEGEEVKASTLFKGLGIAAIGGILNLIISPNRKDYFDFINTFNEGQNGDKLKLSLKVDYDKQMNYGVVLSF